MIYLVKLAFKLYFAAISVFGFQKTNLWIIKQIPGGGPPKLISLTHINNELMGGRHGE